MSLLTKIRTHSFRLAKIKQICYSTSTDLNTYGTLEPEYTETPQYPEIQEMTPEARFKRNKQAYYDEIQAIKTVEEKQIKLNMPKYYGFKCYMLKEFDIPYNSLEMTQFLTRTHLTKQDTLPAHYDNIEVPESFYATLKAKLEDILFLEYENYRETHDLKSEDLSKQEEEKLVSLSICEHINRLFTIYLNDQREYLRDVQVDSSPRIEAFWFAGGMPPPDKIRKHRASIPWFKKYADLPTDRAMQYVGEPNLILRAKQPLPPVVSYEEALNTAKEVPMFRFDPRTIGCSNEYRRAVNVPGFWPGDKYQFGVVSYHNRAYLNDRKFDDYEDALHRQALLASFGWLSAQANFLGFTTYNDITYPLVNQAVITDGKLWSFSVYQLNTLLVHSEYATDNPKRNYCWSTNEIKFFDSVENGKVVGLNEKVLQYLSKFYLNYPRERSGVELKPYLGENKKAIADYEDDDKRQWLEREYKFLMSNRPRYLVPYEIYLWEKIYKIDHKTRPIEPRMRPFELYKNPYRRKLNERQAFYVPKVLRPHLKKNQGRYRQEYFP